MHSSALVLEPKHSTAHARAYSGSLGSLVSHYPGGEMLALHDYVDREKLRRFLVEREALTGEEYAFGGSTNGERFWLFDPVSEEHKRIIEERTGKNTVGGYFIYSSDNPMDFTGDESSLVTSAFVVTPKSRERSSEVWYSPTGPEKFTPESVLRVSNTLQMRPGLFRGYAGGRYRSQNENDHVNTVLTDLRKKIHGGNSRTQLRVDFGYYLYSGIQGISLRTDERDDYAWAQEHMVAILRKMLGNPYVADAAVMKQELAAIALPSSSHTDDEVRKRILDAQRESGQRIIDNVVAHHYVPAVERAARELETDKDVVRALKMM